jgi:hypothetical protein
MAVVNNPNNLIASQKLFPFSTNGKAYVNQQPFLGGRILILTGSTATSGSVITIPHNLKSVPISLLIFYSNIYTPKWQAASTAWTSTNIYIQLDTTLVVANKIVFFIF